MLIFSLVYHGTAAALAAYAAPFIAIAASHRPGTDIYPNLPALTGSSDTDSPCISGQGARVLRPIGLLKYDPPAAAAMVDRFGEFIFENKAFNTSALLLEGYGTKGVQDVPSHSTAFPDRENNIMV